MLDYLSLPPSPRSLAGIIHNKQLFVTLDVSAGLVVNILIVGQRIINLFLCKLNDFIPFLQLSVFISFFLPLYATANVAISHL